MSKIKRTLCAFLAGLLIVITPVRAYAFAPAIPLAAGTFAIGNLLAVAGVCVGVSAVVILIGTWDDADTYAAQGAARKLGTYAQRVYDNARSASSDIAIKYQAIEQTLISIMTATWGAVISGILAIASDIRSFLFSLEGYGTTTMTVPASYPGLHDDAYISSVVFDAVRVRPLNPAGSYINNPDNGFVMSGFYSSSWAGYSYIQNWYKPLALTVYGVYNPLSSRLEFYTADADNKPISYTMFYTYDYISESGAYRWDDYSTNYGKISYCTVSNQYIGGVPFQVFRTLEGLESYLNTGDTAGLIDKTAEGMQTVDVESVNTGVADLPITDVLEDVITLPVDDVIATDKWGALQDAFTNADVGVIDKIIADNIGIVDVPVDPDIPVGDVATLDDVCRQLQDIPGAIADSILGRIKVPQEIEIKSLPKIVITKFPFCIPFDVAYLVESLVSVKEVPRIDIPIKFDYLNFHYDRTFVVDMSEWQTAVDVFRIMQDLLFVAGLIVVTRNLIRG